jgi:hypothetical protein
MPGTEGEAAALLDAYLETELKIGEREHAAVSQLIDSMHWRTVGGRHRRAAIGAQAADPAG